MNKGKAIKFMAGLLSAAILFTSEGMTCLAYAESAEGTILPPPTQISSEEIVEEDTPLDLDMGDEETTDIPEESDEDENVPADEEDPENPDPGTDDGEDNEEEIPTDPEITDAPEDSESVEDEIPSEEKTADQGTGIPSESISENNMAPFVDPASEVTGFEIVDEAGNKIEGQTIYIEQGKSRHLSVRLEPENAVAEKILWEVDNENISVTDGMISLVPETISQPETGTVTVSIGKLTKTCRVEFMPLATDLEIYQDGNAIPESGITIVPGQQIQLEIKLLPEGAVSSSTPHWYYPSYFRIDDDNILTVIKVPDSYTQVFTVTASLYIQQNQYAEKDFKVTIAPPDEPALNGIRCGDILFYPSGGLERDAYKQIDETTWLVNASKTASPVKLSYLGEDKYPIIEYINSTNDLNSTHGRIPYIQGNTIYLNKAFMLQIFHNSKRYVILFKTTSFAISPSQIETVPFAKDQELVVKFLPDGFDLANIQWKSGDERIVRIKEKTDRGVILQFGQGTGQTKITAIAEDDWGPCYATCDVNVSMTLPRLTFNSDSGGDIREEKTDSEGYPYLDYYWLIDKGGKVEISMPGVPQAKIYYTTNGSDPRKNGVIYRSPITINQKTDIRAFAELEGFGTSPDAWVEFRIGNPNISISPASVTLTEDSTRNISVKAPTGAEPLDIIWKTNDDWVATAETVDHYNQDGDFTGYTYEITAGASGKCIITASIKDYAGRTQTASCAVTVTGALQITPEITVTEEESDAEKRVIKITKRPPNSSKDDTTWTWRCSDEDLIKLNSDNDGNMSFTVGKLTDTTTAKIVTVTAIVDVEDPYPYRYCASCHVTVVPRSYKVTFLGWNDTVAKIEIVNRGQSVKPPTEEEMNAAAPKGYEFNGWASDESAWSDVQVDATIKAKPYILKSYTITYETGSGGDNASENPRTYTVEDDTIGLKAATPADSSTHSFAGWYLDQDYSDSPITEIPKGSTGDITLYAKWRSAKTGLWVKLETGDWTYTGKAITPEVTVFDGETTLTPGTDYTIKYKNNIKAADTTDPKAPTVTVTGKGNYKGADTTTFVINPQSIAKEEASVVIPDMYLAYNKGKKLTIVPTVTWNGKKLKNNTEFKVTKIVNKTASTTAIEECKEAGEYTVTVEGVGNFAGARDISLSVTDKKLLSKVKFNGKIKDISWDTLQGETLAYKNIAVDEDITLTDGKVTLEKGKDYTVTYDTDIKEVGTYKVVFTGTGDNYAGEVTKTFKVIGKTIKASNLVIENLQTLTYNGKEQVFDEENGVAPLVISYKNGKSKVQMTHKVDYNLTYENTTNAGNKATVVITGINGYTGIVKKAFKISPYSMKDDPGKKIKISLENGADSVPYEKGGVKPKLNVTFGGETLVEGKDYTVSYKNNKKVTDQTEPNPPTYTVKGKGNFKDSAFPQAFSISEQDIANLTITAEDVMAAAPKKGENIGKTGAGKYKSTPKLTDINGKALSAGTDFLKTYTYTNESGGVLGPKDQVTEGAILTVTVQGSKNYTGVTRTSYRVLAAKKSVAKASVSITKEAKAKIQYDLEPVTLKKENLIVKIGKEELDRNDYTIISYVNNRKKGTAKVTIQGVGDYGGRKTVNFTINPRIFSFIKP